MTAPLVPADVNLRGLPWMRLDTTRLLDSDLFALSTGDEFKAAVALWCKSWTQLPAASLPTDDRVLAHLSGAGPRWKKVKAMALRGWIEADDGRLYHPIVAEQAIAAWEERQEFRAEIESQNERKRRERDERAQMFEQLKAAGHHLAWNTPTGKLRELVTALPSQPVTQNGVTGVTGHSDSHGLDGTGRDGILKAITPDRSLRAERSLGEEPRSLPALAGTGAGRAAAALNRAGLRITSQNPNLIEAVEREGVTVELLLEVHALHPDKSAGYVIQAARGIRAERAQPITTGESHAASPSSGRASLADRVRSTATPDHHDERDVLEGTATRLTD
jgi:hypothetical protein